MKKSFVRNVFAVVMAGALVLSSSHATAGLQSFLSKELGKGFQKTSKKASSSRSQKRLSNRKKSFAKNFTKSNFGFGKSSVRKGSKCRYKAKTRKRGCSRR